MQQVIHGFKLVRKESYCGRTTPIVDWSIYDANGSLVRIYDRKKDALEYIEACKPKDDARLVSAAPDMLRALEHVLSDLNSELDHETALIIQSAIAKAKGE